MVAVNKLKAKKDINGLIHVLNSRDNTVRRDAAKAISSLAKKGIIDVKAVLPLIGLLSDRHKHVRKNAAFALGDLAEHDEIDRTAILPLVKLLSDRDEGVRWSAAFALRVFAKKGVLFNNEVQSFERLLFDAYKRVRYNAASALGYLAMYSYYDKSTLFPLISLLSDRNSLVRANSAFALGCLAKENIFDVSSVEPLIKLLSDWNDFVRKKAAEALKELKLAGVLKSDADPNITISRETEFYQGFIRLKMSITNTTVFVINDVTLDFHFDEVLLRMDRHEPNYPIKNGKIILGNINSSSSKSVAVYFDPMMCSKGTEINCQINYIDAKGQIQTTWMEPKSISVVCPIIETDSDINIGRLKEFVEKLPHRDSTIYQIHTGFDIDSLKAISREVIQKHDVKHIRSLHTKDGKTCEIWYYGKTKINNYDIVIKITISSENQSIELFAATQTAESLTGLLAEFGRELLLAIEDKITGINNVNQVINVSIKDSIIQRSNLLSYCDIDGKCTGDVVVEDSIVRRSDIAQC